MNTIAILILAAGGSSRMKEKIKQLLPWRKTTLLGHAIAEAKKLKVQKVCVVLGANAELIKSTIGSEKITILDYKNWEQGIGTTIAFGVDYLAKENKYDAILIILADQPLMDANYLELLLSTYNSDSSKIIATKYADTIGVPAIFGKEYFDELVNLSGDSGAKKLLSFKNVVVLNPKGKVVDIDTWEEYERLKTKSGS